MIKEINCNLLDAPVDAICHVANCQNTMGSGVAKAIREVYPEAYEADCLTIKGDKNKLGTFSKAYVSTFEHLDNINIKVIYNLYAQFDYARSHYGETRHLSYDALYKCLEKLRLDLGEMSLGLPYKMGSDRAGGNFNIVKCMIEEVFKHNSNEILICRL
jgi:O-acetyl-ADP-ribose deacetylase (regulator of RNase III)